MPDALLFDLDGTLYRGNEMIPGADRLIAGLQRKGTDCWYVTNNSTRSPKDVAVHLQGMGIPAEADRIVTSALAAAYYVKSTHPDAPAFVIGEQGLREALADVGHNLADDNGSEAGIVVQGLDRLLTYERLTLAVRHILNGAVFVQTNPDRLLPTDGGFLPGAGSIGAALEAATGKAPVVIGKPSKILMDYALMRTGTAPERTWVIGDNPYTDLAAARNAGCPSLLVLTGLCSEHNWQAHCRTAEVEPQAVFAGPDEMAAFFGVQGL